MSWAVRLAERHHPKEYISRLTEVFTEVRRVLRSDGTLWLNISDTYAGKGNQVTLQTRKIPNGRNGQTVALNNKVEGCKPKDLIGIPVDAGLCPPGFWLVSTQRHHLDEGKSHAGERERPLRPML
jgi:hypothetical protein